MTQILLLLHIFAGPIALAVAGRAVGSAKAGRLHRRAGNIYALAMLIAGASAVVLAVVHPNAFLAAVGLSSFTLSSRAGARRCCAPGSRTWPIMPGAR